MRYIVMQEIKSPTKVAKHIFLKDFFFLFPYGVATFVFSWLVYKPLTIPYYLFSCVMGVFLTLPSFYNPKRRNYETILLKLRKTSKIYKPIINISCCEHPERVSELLEMEEK